MAVSNAYLFPTEDIISSNYAGSHVIYMIIKKLNIQLYSQHIHSTKINVESIDMEKHLL